jgi:PKD domain
MQINEEGRNQHSKTSPSDQCRWSSGLRLAACVVLFVLVIEAELGNPTLIHYSFIYAVSTEAKINQRPIANAGNAQLVQGRKTIKLNGEGSSDPDSNDSLIYAWEFISKPQGSAVSLDNSSSMRPSFTPDLPGEYILTLVVTDSQGLASAAAEVAVTGPDQSILRKGSTVLLNGGGSHDPDKDELIYRWTITSKPQGSMAVLSNETSASASLEIDVHGDYEISLIVTDSFGAESEPDTVKVTFRNVKPVANAGEKQTVITGTLVQLNANKSFDENQDPLSYKWHFDSKPPGSTATLNEPTAVQPTFTADLLGDYVISLVVNDNIEDSEPKQVTITGQLGVNSQDFEQLVAFVSQLRNQLSQTEKTPGWLSKVDRLLEPSLAATLAGLVLAAAAFLFSVEQGLSATRVGDARGISTILERKSAAISATDWMILSFYCFVAALITSLAIDPEADIGKDMKWKFALDRTRSEWGALVDLTGSGGGTLLGLLFMILGVRKIRHAVSLDTKDIKKEIEQIKGINPEAIAEKNPVVSSGEGASPQKSGQNERQSTSIPTQPGIIRRATRRFVRETGKAVGFFKSIFSGVSAKLG